jgi:anti-sigma regulatory factor (Ser/Thr protein kinase)
LLEPPLGTQDVRYPTYATLEREEGRLVHHEVSIPASRDAPRMAREVLDRWLSALVGQPTTAAVRLAASELVTNAVRHGRLAVGSALRLSVDVGERTVHVDVQQATATSDAEVVSDRPAGSGGFGMAIVEDVADRWGVVDGTPGSVWFDVDRRGPA